MAVRRTLKQKQRAQVHRLDEVTYEYEADKQTPVATTKLEVADTPKLVSHAEPSLSLKLFGYNPNLVYNDLLKTLLVTILILAILIGIFFAMR